MTTYKELVYYVLDALKLVSDDSVIQPEHVLFLLDKYRGFILKQRYSDIKKEIPESNYQTICLDLKNVEAYENDACGGNGYLRSEEKVPNMMTIGGQKISTLDYFQGDIAYVNRDRFKYVGGNKYLRNTIYGTIGPDSYLYLKSSNPQAYHLCKVRLTGIFEDSAKASELSCDEDATCDVMDRNYPLEEGLIPAVLELVIKDVGGQKYQAEDKQNDASDDLSNLAAYIRQQLANGRRSDLYRNYQ